MALLILFFLLGLSFSLEVFSEKLEIKENEIIAEGDAEAYYKNYYIKAKKIKLLRDKDEVYAYEDVYIKNLKTGFEIRGSFAYVNMKKNKGYFLNAKGKFREFNFEAKKIEQLDKERFKVYEATVTTCPLDDKELYLCIFRANITKERALIFHNRLKFFKVPIFYLPVYLIPLGGRKTGFLMPTIGSSTYSSFIYIQPFFWAISRDKDMTITADYRKDQMKGLSLEYRQAFDEESDLITQFSLYKEDKKKGDWWKGREMYRENRFRIFMKYRKKPFKIGVAELSDPYYYEDISFKQEEITKPYTKTYLIYEKETKNYLFYFQTVRYRDLTEEKNNAVNLLPEASFHLKPFYYKGFNFSLDSSFTNFYRNYDGSFMRISLEPTVGKYFELFKVSNYSSLTLINRYYPDSEEDKIVSTFRFRHSVPQYFSLSYGGFKFKNFLEGLYTFSPKDYEVQIFDYQDELNEENNFQFTLVGNLYKNRKLMDYFLNTGYNLLGSYTFPTDGKKIDKKLLPLYYNVSVYPVENVRFWQDAVYDFNLGVFARNVIGTDISWKNFSVGISNSVYKNSEKKVTTDQIALNLKYSGDKFFSGISLNYDRLVDKETYRNVYVGVKGKCWSLVLDYKRNYYRNRDEYVDQVFLRFNLFFKEEIEIPLRR